MKKILIIEDVPVIQKMYVSFLEANFPNLLIHVCAFLQDGIKAIKDFNGFDLYILDGTVLGGHTCDIIEQLPKENVIVISAEALYMQECQEKGIKAYMKPFTWTKLRENLQVFTDILNK